MDDIKGLRFSLDQPELRQLILDCAARLEVWLNKHAEEQGTTLYVWRSELYDMLHFGAEHLEDHAMYHLDRNEVRSLFQQFEDGYEQAI